MGQDETPTTSGSAAPEPARGGAPPPPTPVRASLGAETGGTVAEEPSTTTAEVEVDGVSWTVRVGGMSSSGAAGAAAPILLLRFESREEGDAAPRESWVVGRSLRELTELQIEAAFGRSAPAPEAWSRKPIFPEAGSRSGKDG